MSRITAVRSMAVRPRIFSRLRCWAGDRSSSNTTVSASISRHISKSSSALPLPRYVAESGAVRRCVIRPATSAPAVSTKRANSFSPASVAAGVP